MRALERSPAGSTGPGPDLVEDTPLAEEAGGTRPAVGVAPSSRRVTAARAALTVIAACVGPALYFAFVWEFGVDALKFDEWVFVPMVNAAMHGHLSFGIVWSQYNESYMLVPDLVWVVFGLTTHIDTKSIMLFDATLFTGSYGVLLLIWRRIAGRWPGPLYVLAVGLVWFSLADWENALWGFQVAWYLTLFFVLAMLLVLSRREITPVGLAIAMVLAATASLCTVQGFLAWPVGLLCLWWRLAGRSRWRSFGGPWVAVGVVTAGVYFWHYNVHDAGGAGTGGAAARPATVVEFLLAEAGNVFPGNYPVALHACIGFVVLVAATGVLIVSWSEHRHDPGPYTLPLSVALIVYALLFDVSVAFGRVSFGLGAALWSRYTMTNLLLVVGILLFVFLRSPHRPGPSGTPLSPRLIAGGIVVVVLLAAQIGTSTSSGLENARADRAKQILGARIAVNSALIPVMARQELVATDLFPSGYGYYVELAAIARQDQLAEFAPAPFQHYRALGPPPTKVRTDLARWCTVAPGSTRRQAYERMGGPHGSAFAPWARALEKLGYLSPGYAEWDVGSDVLIADFRNGRVTTLQSFSVPLPNRAADTACDAVRG